MMFGARNFFSPIKILLSLFFPARQSERASVFVVSHDCVFHLVFSFAEFMDSKISGPMNGLLKIIGAITGARK